MTDYSIAGSSGTTGLSPLTDPAPGDKMAAVDVSDNSTPPAGSAGSDKWLTIGQLLGVANYYFPTGDTSGVDDPGNINAILAAGDPVVLLDRAAGNNYYLASSITPVTGSFLGSLQAWSASEQDFYGAGTGQPGGAVLYMVNAFPTGAYAIDLYNTTTTQAYGADIAGLCIYGEALPSHTVNTSGGIRIHGAWGAGRIRNVTILGTNGDGLHCEVDDTTGKVTDEWRFEFVKITGSYGGYGIWGDNVPDSSFLHCQTSNCALDGTRLGWSTNTRLDHHKSEQNGQAGYHFTGLGSSGDVLWVTACTTHVNNQDGFLWDNGSAGTGGGIYQLVNCGTVNDGQAGGTTYAGYRSNGCRDLIMAAGCSAQQAYYGAAEIGSSLSMVFTGSSLSGTGANTYDDGSNTVPLANVVPVGGPYPFPGAVTAGVVTLAYASTLNINAALGGHFRVVLAGNATVAAPTNPADGQKITFEPIQDATGGRTLTWNSAFDFGSGSAPALSAASKGDLLGFVYSANRGKWLFAGAGPGGY